MSKTLTVKKALKALYILFMVALISAGLYAFYSVDAYFNYHYPK